MTFTEPRTGTLIVQKIGTTGFVSTDLWPVRIGHTSEELYEHAVYAEQARAEAAAQQYSLARMWSALLDVDNPALQAVLQLHAPDTEARSWLTCRRCDANEMDPGDWPCSTVTTAAAWHGIGLDDSSPDRACLVCGCTDDRACPGGCFWVGPDLCSRCQS